MKAGDGAAIDTDALIAPFLPPLYDSEGHRVEPIAPTPRPEGQDGGPISTSPGAGSTAKLLDATLSRRGQEERLMINGELMARRAIHFIEIRYPGGRSFLNFQNLDVKDFDPSQYDPNKNDVRVERSQMLPSSERVLVSWDAVVGGRPAVLSAGIDKTVIDDGVAELRRRTIPKVVAGGVVFMLLLLLAYIYVFRLLRESRRLEAEARQQALLAQVGMLAAGLAHEIRNPLSAVQMNLQLIEEDLSGASAAEGVEGVSEHLGILRSTQREIRRLGSLVSDFLTYARPSAPRRAPCSLDATVRDGVQLFVAAARQSGVEIELDLQAGDPPLLADEAMLKQALMNIVVNALDAVAHPGGRVIVSTRREAGNCVVSVRDDGPGLPADPETVFAVFHSTKKGGTGLGLSIARALIERQGGRLVGRNRSQGAEFVMTVPAEPAGEIAA